MPWNYTKSMERSLNNWDTQFDESWFEIIAATQILAELYYMSERHYHWTFMNQISPKNKLSLPAYDECDH